MNKKLVFPHYGYQLQTSAMKKLNVKKTKTKMMYIFWINEWDDFFSIQNNLVIDNDDKTGKMMMIKPRKKK